MKELDSYNVESVQNMSYDKLSDFISIKTTDGELIFLDDIVSINHDSIALRYGISFGITSEEKYNILIDKLKKFKMFKLFNNESSVEIMREKNRLQEEYNTLVAKNTDLIKTQLDEIKTHIQVSIVGAKMESLNEMKKSLNKMESSAIDARQVINHLSNTIELKMKKIDDHKFAHLIDKLNKVTDVLSDVFEEE